MSERFYGRISIPKVFVEREDVQELIRREFQNLVYEEQHENDGVVHFSCDEAYFGMFQELEDGLQKLGIPYDRYSEKYASYDEEIVYFRPDEPDSNRRLIRLELHDEKPFIRLHRLQRILEGDPNKLRENLENLLNEVHPQVTPLSAWGNLTSSAG